MSRYTGDVEATIRFMVAVEAGVPQRPRRPRPEWVLTAREAGCIQTRPEGDRVQLGSIFNMWPNLARPWRDKVSAAEKVAAEAAKAHVAACDSTVKLHGFASPEDIERAEMRLAAARATLVAVQAARAVRTAVRAEARADIIEKLRAYPATLVRPCGPPRGGR